MAKFICAEIYFEIIYIACVSNNHNTFKKTCRDGELELYNKFMVIKNISYNKHPIVMNVLAMKRPMEISLLCRAHLWFPQKIAVKM